MSSWLTTLITIKINEMLKQGMKPTHPGQILKEIYLDPLGINQAVAANNLGITRKTLSMLLNGRQGISAEMALRLGKAFGTTPELWLNMQCNYDLWNAGQKVKLSQIRAFRRPSGNTISGSRKVLS
jgi:addiction module HigA family antidote